MLPPPVEWLKEAKTGRMPLTAVNVWKALRYKSYVQVLDFKGNVISHVVNLKDCCDLRITKRGFDYLEEAKNTVTLPFNRENLPQAMQLWINTFRRWTRNCPAGVVLTFSDGELRVLVKDTSGKAKDDEKHLLAAAKISWLDQTK
jgi:hypothetical protein